MKCGVVSGSEVCRSAVSRGAAVIDVPSRPLMVSAVRAPSIQVLTHRGQHHAKEPAFTAGDAGVIETEIEFLAFDRTFGARAAVGMEFP